MSHLDATSSLEAWTRALARSTISPAGGSAAAVTGAMAASLVAMVSGMTLDRPAYASVHGDAQRILEEATHLRTTLLELAAEDARVCTLFSDALTLPASTETERSERGEMKRRALAECARVQEAVARHALAIAELGVQVASLAPVSTLGDTASASFLAAAAVRSAYWATASDVPNGIVVEPDLLDRAAEAERHVANLLRTHLMRLPTI